MQTAFNAVVFILAISVSGWAQQTLPANPKHGTAGKHTKTIEYRNVEYGFSLTLPESWKGYRVMWSDWGGSVLKDDGSSERVVRGPRLQIRHPKWTEQNPREDMPIMIFTISQCRECCSIRPHRTWAQSEVRYCCPASLGLRLCRRLGGSARNSNC
jgi:hypothetical protein